MAKTKYKQKQNTNQNRKPETKIRNVPHLRHKETLEEILGKKLVERVEHGGRQTKTHTS